MVRRDQGGAEQDRTEQDRHEQREPEQPLGLRYVGLAFLATLLLILLVLVACATPSAPVRGTPASPAPTGASSPAPGTPSPTATAGRSTRCTPTGADTAQHAVTEFLAALSRQDAPAVCRLFSAELRADYETSVPAFDTWVANQLSAVLRSPLKQQSDQGDPNPKLAAYRDLQIIAANYDAKVRTETMLDASGPRIRFFIVGRAGTNGPWLILSIGTGP